MRPVTPIKVLKDDKKTLLDETKEILDIVAKSDMVLASGHLHVSETWVVFEEAKRRGVKRLVFTHPEDIVDGTLNDVKGIAAMGAFIEHSLCMFLDGCKFKSREAEDLKNQIDAGGIGQTILASDLGQVGTYAPLDGMRRGIKLCMDLGYSDDDIRQMVSTNTARALGIEADVEAATSKKN